jgi:peptide chain release factor subunit 1
MDRIKKYEFKKILEELRSKSGRGTELVSVYIPPHKQISDVVSHLRDEHGQAMNIKSKSTRTNVQSALDSILSRLRYLRLTENGIAIFCGTIDMGGDKNDIQSFIVEPPEKILSYIYRCDSVFLLDPLEDMLAEKDKYGLIVLDKREATLGTLTGKVVEPLKHITSAVPGKQRKGGWSQQRFQRLREIAVEDFYKRIGEHASRIFLQIGAGAKDIKGILIGGPSPTKEEFIKGSYLHYELQEKIIDSFDVAYTDESGLFELMDKAEGILEGLDLMKEKRIMTRFMRLLTNSETIVAYGEEEVREKLGMGAVDTLLLSEDIDREKMKSLMEKAKTVGTNVEVISIEFEEGTQLKKAFGGIAAILRYGTKTS